MTFNLDESEMTDDRSMFDNLIMLIESLANKLREELEAVRQMRQIYYREDE